MRRTRELSLVLSSLTDGVVVFDPSGQVVETNEPALRFLEDASIPAGLSLSERFARLLVPPPRNPVSGAPMEASPVEDQPLVRILGGETIQGVKVRVPRGEGSPLWLSVTGTHIRDDSGALVGTTVVMRDITAHLPRGAVVVTHDVAERRRAEEAARERGEQFSRIFHRSPVGMAITRPSDGTILEANQSFLDLGNFTRDEVVGKTTVGLSFWPTPADRDRAMEILRRQGSLSNYELATRDAAGRLHHALLSIERIAFEGQQAFLAIAYDVTMERAAQDALRESESRARALSEELREADRRKDGFLAVLSHELRNPLASVANCLSILEHVEPGSDQTREATETARRQMNLLTHLVDDLLDFSRVAHGRIDLQTRPLDLSELVFHTAEDHRLLFERRGVRLVLERPPAPVRVRGDGDRLVQVVSNLLCNAAKFTASGDTTQVSVGTDAERHFAVIRVADTGVGMTAETLGRIFVPFAQADRSLDRSGGGLGLGLALVKDMVELHRGRVRAASSGVGQGSEFVVELPLLQAADAEAPAGAEAQRETTAEIASEATTRVLGVLVIEDNADVAATFAQLLRLDGHEVSVAGSGPEGLALAGQFHPDVVLCDIGLPGMDGYQVARAMRVDKTLAGTYLVAVTGYVSAEDIRLAEEAGFDQHLAKPVSLRAIREMLSVAAGR